MTSYLVIARDGEAEIEAKRSRFLCTLERVADEAAARAVVDRLRKEHWDARHHCSAFVLGPGAQVERSSDDGEPAGTAGAPMLEVLRGRGVSDVGAVLRVAVPADGVDRLHALLAELTAGAVGATPAGEHWTP